MVSDDVLIKLIKENRGNLSAVARQSGLVRSAIAYRVSKTDRLKEAVDEARDAVLDAIEDKLFEKAMLGEDTPMIFTLKTIGKSRGYVERSEVQNDHEININIKYDEGE